MSRLSLLRAGTAAIALCASLPAIAQTSNPLNLPTQGNIVPGTYPAGIEQKQVNNIFAGSTVGFGTLGAPTGLVNTQASGNQILLNLPAGTTLNTPVETNVDLITPVNPGPFATSQTTTGEITALTELTGTVVTGNVRTIATANLFEAGADGAGSGVNIGQLKQTIESGGFGQTAATIVTSLNTGGSVSANFVTAAQGNIASFGSVKVNMPLDGQTILQSNANTQTATQTLKVPTPNFQPDPSLFGGPVTFSATATGNAVFASGPTPGGSDIFIDRIEQATTNTQSAESIFRNGTISDGTIRTVAFGNIVELGTSPTSGFTIVDNLNQQVKENSGQTAKASIGSEKEFTAGPLNVLTSARGNVFTLTGGTVAGDSGILQSVSGPQLATTQIVIPGSNAPGDLTVGTFASGNNASLTGGLVRGNSISGNDYVFAQETTTAGSQTATLNASSFDVGSKTAFFDTRAVGNQLSFSANNLQDIQKVNQSTQSPQAAFSNVFAGGAGALTVQTFATGNIFQFSSLPTTLP